MKTAELPERTRQAAPQKQTTTHPRRRTRESLGAVLVPTDFSAESLKAVDCAAALLDEHGGTLHLVHVHDLDYSAAVPSLLAAAPVAADGEIDRAIRAELGKLTANCTMAASHRPVLHVRVGRAFDQICATAREINASLLVTATHGRTGLKHLTLGSTAERVVQHAPCPVLVLHEREHELLRPAPANGAGRLRLATILVPIDFSDCSRHGLSYAIALAARRRASLVLVHVIQAQPLIPTERGGYDRVPSPRTLERLARQQMRRFVAAVDFRGVSYKTSIQLGRSAQQICAFASENDVDLIVTSTHGRTGFSHVLIGSTAEHVVGYARCPVLVVPRRDGRVASQEAAPCG